MTSFAPIPDPDEIPEGFRHVGWHCAAPNHDCLMPLSRAESEPRDGEVYLLDANHHAHWVPVYAPEEPSQSRSLTLNGFYDQ